MPPIAFVGPTYASRSLNLDAQRCVNLYVEVDETKEGKTPSALYGTPGLKLFATIPGSHGIRGNGLFTTSTGRTFVIHGNGLYELTSSGSTTLYGTLSSTEGPVSIADNALQMVIVDGAHGYIFDLTANTFATITDPDFPGADRVQFLDDYLLFNRPNSSQFFWSSLAGVDFDALDFSAVDGFPDKLISLLVINREIRLFGATTTEPWFNVGDVNNPFQRIQGAFSQQGIAAAQSVASIGDAHCWLTNNADGFAMVYLAAGGQTQRVSTHAIETVIQSYSVLSDAIAWGEQQEGHQFYWLTFPTANATWVYDLTTGLWHERAWLNPTTGALDRHRANAHCVAFGKHLVGDWENGNVYHLDYNTYDDNGNPLKWLRRVPYVHATKGPSNLPYVFHNVATLDMETGVGLDGTGQGVDPQVMLRWSDDNGHSYSNERWASAGKIGQRIQRLYWPRLGRSRARVYEWSGSDPCKRAFLGAHLESEVATA